MTLSKLAHEVFEGHVPWQFDVCALGDFEDCGRVVSADGYLAVARRAQEKAREFEDAADEMWRRVLCYSYDLKTWKPLPAPAGVAVVEEVLRGATAMTLALTKMAGAMRSCLVALPVIAEGVFGEKGAGVSGKKVNMRAELKMMDDDRVLCGCPVIFRDVLKRLEVFKMRCGFMRRLLGEKVVSVEMAQVLLEDLEGVKVLLVEYGRLAGNVESCVEKEVYELAGVELLGGDFLG